MLELLAVPRLRVGVRGEGVTGSVVEAGTTTEAWGLGSVLSGSCCVDDLGFGW